MFTKCISPLFFLLLCFCACSLVKADALPVTMHMRGLAIQAETLNVHIQTGVRFSQIEALQILLEDGVVVHFTYGINILRERILWVNTSLANASRTIRLSYDPLTKDFLAVENDALVGEYKELNKLLLKVTGKLIFALPLKTPLGAGKTYRIVAKVSLQESDMPQWVQAFLLFGSWDIVHPIKLSQKFTF